MYKDSVIPLYVRHTDTKKYVSIGSAVLIEHHHKRFLITAAHVVESMKGHKAFIFFDNTFYEFNGVGAFLSSLSPFDSRDNDPVDLAAIPLPSALEIQSANTPFITDQMYQRGEAIASPFYQALGYPHSKNSRAANHTVKILGKFRSEGLRYTARDAGEMAFPYKSFCPKYHIATYLTKDGRSQGETSKSPLPDLRGMSGGLLQKVNQYDIKSDSFLAAYPSGLILEKSKDEKVFYSLRLFVVFEWLNEHLDRIQIPLNNKTT